MAVDECDRLLQLIHFAKSHPPLPKGKHQRVLPPPQGFEAIYSRLFAIYEDPEFQAFSELINAIALGIPNYYHLVDRPVALRTILDNIVEGNKYATAEDVKRDLRQIRENSAKFNGKDSEFTSIAYRMIHKLDDQLKLATKDEIEQFSFLVENSTEEAMQRAFHAINAEVPHLVQGESVDLDQIHSGIVQHVIQMMQNEAKK
jgi:hypothetical protein